MTTFSVMGIPLACDTRTGGMAEAPSAWRRAGVMNTLAALGGVDQGDVFATAIVGKDQEAFQARSNETKNALADIETPVVLLGGDCTIAPGVMAAVAPRRPLLLWLDAHGDFNTVDTTPSGYWPGMPLARVAGLNTPLGPARPILPGADIVLVGARDLDPGEGENALGVEATILPGAPPTLDRLPSRPTGASVWIHLDLDVLDPSEMPAINFPVPGGWRSDELISWVGEVGRRYRIIGLEVTAFDPRRDPTGQVAQRLIGWLGALVQAAWMG